MANDPNAELLRKLMQSIGSIKDQPSASSPVVMGQGSSPDVMSLLRNSTYDWSKNNVNYSKPKEKGFVDKITGGQGLLGGLFDILSRGAYTSGSAFKELGNQGTSMGDILPFLKKPKSAGDLLHTLNSFTPTGVATNLASSIGLSDDPGEIVKQAGQGFIGRSKVLPSQVAKEQDLIPKTGVGGFASGLALDVLTDPTTYIGAGAIKSSAKGVGSVGRKLLGKNAPVVENAVEEIATAKAATNISDAATAQVVKDYAKDAVKAAGHPLNGSKTASKADIRAVLDGVIKKSETLPQQAVQRYSGALAAVAKSGNIMPARNAPLALPKTVAASKHVLKDNIDKAVAGATFRSAINAQTRALRQELPDVIPARRVTTANIPKQQVMGGILSRVRTWHGNKNLRPDIEDIKGSAEFTTNKRLGVINNAFKPLKSPDDIYTAFRVAQGSIPRNMVDSPELLHAADELTKSMESLFSSSGIKGKIIQGNSLMTRMGASMDDMNEMLKFYGAKTKLTNGKVVNELGREVDYSKNLDFLKSWEATKLEGKEVLPEMRKIILATEMLARRNAFLDDLAETIGSKTPKEGFVQAKNARLTGVYFPKEMASEINVALDRMLELYRPNSKGIKHFRDVTNIMKMFFTIINPQHHVNNVMGDVFLGWMNGVNNPEVYRKAGVILRNQSKALNSADLATLEKSVGQDAIKSAITSKKGKVIGSTSRGLKYTDEQAYIAAHQLGLFRDMHVIEDITDAPISIRLSSVGNYATNPFKVGSKVSEVNSQWTRLSHFLDALSKSKADNLEQAFKESAHTVRKWHPDGSDLTEFEQKVKLVVPFYSWMRKSIPLIIEGAVLNPGKISATNKLFYNMQTARGEQSELSNPFQTAGSMWPGWISPPGTTNAVFAPRNPFNDLATQVVNPKDTLAGAITPLVKVPTELLLEKRLGSGIPIRDKTEYLMKSTPGLGKSMSLMNPTNEYSRLNWLTGLGITPPKEK